MMKALSFHLFLNFRNGWWWKIRFSVRTEIIPLAKPKVVMSVGTIP